MPGVAAAERVSAAMKTNPNHLIFGAIVRGKLAQQKIAETCRYVRAQQFLEPIVATPLHEHYDAAVDLVHLLHGDLAFRDCAILDRVDAFLDHMRDLGEEHAEMADCLQLRLAIGEVV
jgi:hypothetical protein